MCYDNGKLWNSLPAYVIVSSPPQSKTKTKTVSEKPRKRKPKKEKDSNKPKRPQSAYFIWLNESREQIKKENPGISITEISKVAGQKWKTIENKKVRLENNTMIKSH